jgi:hypothetical protein
MFDEDSEEEIQLPPAPRMRDPAAGLFGGRDGMMP